MPFGLAEWPNLGISLLKASLQAANIACDVRYFSLNFANQIGRQFYASISEDVPPYLTMVGEWIFSHAMRQVNQHDGSKYIQWIRSAEPDFFSDEMIAQIHSAKKVTKPFMEYCLETLNWEEYDIIGFTNSVQQQNASLALTKLIKGQHPETTIIFGGHNVGGDMGVEFLRQYQQVDYVCNGEGDRLLPDLVLRLRESKSVEDLPGLIYRHNGIVIANHRDQSEASELDELPFPDFDDFFVQYTTIFHDDKWRGLLPIETSRGCWWRDVKQCAFCGNLGEELCYRRKKTARIVEELIFLKERYEPGVFITVDDIAPRDICETFTSLNKQNIKYKFFYNLRPTVDKAQLEVLKQNGVNEVLIGFETLSTPILKGINKGVKAITNIQVLKWCREYGIKVYWNFIYGFPLEDPNEYQRMVALIPALTHLMPPKTFGPVFLLRFSPYFNHPEHYGIKNLRPYPGYSYVLPDIPVRGQTRLARYFEFDYRDQRDPENYTEAIRKVVKDWQEGFGNSFFTYCDDGNTLRLFDHRPISQESTVFFTGLKRELYLACDKRRSIKQLNHLYAHRTSCTRIQEILNTMLEKRWMICEDDFYLSLAVDIGKHIRPEMLAEITDDFCVSLSHAFMGTTSNY